MPRIYTEHAHRAKIYGMGKEELAEKVQDFARLKLGINITKGFLKQFVPEQLYGAMRAAQSGRMHRIFYKWQVAQKEKAVQQSLPF